MPCNRLLIAQALSTHSRAVWALVMVSSVVKVLEQTMNRVSSAIQVARRLDEVSAIHIRDETEGHVALAVIFQGLVGHDRPEVGAADANIDYVSDALAGMAFPRAAANLVGELRPSCRARREPRHDVLPSTKICSPFGARKATCRTARCSVTLIFSPANMASMCWRRRGLLRKLNEQPHRLAGDSVLRVIKVEAQRLQRKAFAALRILREKLSKV